jgi:hypothetical protein
MLSFSLLPTPHLYTSFAPLQVLNLVPLWLLLVQTHLSKKQQKPKDVVSLTWACFKEFISNRFTHEYQGFQEGMNLVLMKHIGSHKTYVCDSKAQMNATSKMDEFQKKCIILGGLQKLVVDALFKFITLHEDTAGIISILKKLNQINPEEVKGPSS